MLLISLLACVSATPSWALFTPVEVECGPSEPGEAAAPDAPLDPEFAEAMRRAACAEDPLNCDSDGEETVEAAPEPPTVVEAAPPEETVEAPVEPDEPASEVVAEAPKASLPPPVGLADQPNWGVRLLKTLPTAQPPRAALGLADGTELVVSPGSMIPEAGLVIVSVGDGIAQIATVEAAGDHAEIETLTLHAQY